MQRLTNWTLLWQELSDLNYRWRLKSNDRWGYQPQQAEAFAEKVKQRWQTPDSSRQFILSYIDSESTCLDIGSGIGAWAALIAQKARWVTAIEPASAMIDLMKSRLKAESITNVSIIQDTWPEACVQAHDFSLCSHAMYGVIDLPAFIRRMVEVTRRTCFFLIRAPSMDGVMAEATRLVLGHPHDSPNFCVAYNVFIEMGIYPNVLMENSGKRKSWSHTSLESARDEIKMRLGVDGSDAYDADLMDLLTHRLTYQDGCYIWPPAVQSALIYWDVSAG